MPIQSHILPGSIDDGSGDSAPKGSYNVKLSPDRLKFDPVQALYLQYKDGTTSSAR